MKNNSGERKWAVQTDEEEDAVTMETGSWLHPFIYFWEPNTHIGSPPVVCKAAAERRADTLLRNCFSLSSVAFL